MSYISVVALSIYALDRVRFVEKSVRSVLNVIDDKCCLFIVLDGDVGKDIDYFINDILEKDDRVVVLSNTKNKGLAYSMNRVIDYLYENNNSHIKYFFRMDADDVCFPERFQKQISYLEQHQLDILGAGCIEIDENDNQIGMRCMPIAHDEIIAAMPRRCSINHPTVLIRFDIFRAGFRYNQNLMNTQDYYLWADLLAAGYRIGNYPEPLLYFRRDSNFLSRRGKKKAVNDLKARFNMMRKLGKMTPFNILS